MFQKVRQAVLESGIWDNGQNETHGFILSPDVYKISEEKRKELDFLGAALHDCLSGIGRIAAIALSPQLCHGVTWDAISRTLCAGIPTVYRDLMIRRPGAVPYICKVDIMESESGDYRIAEIDGHNKHGLGYSTLAAKIRKIVSPCSQSFAGVAYHLAQEMKNRNQNDLTMLYADQERFYLPELVVLKREMENFGINLFVISESEASSNGGSFFKKNEKESATLVDLPFLYHSKGLSELLSQLYKAGRIDFLIPPKPFLGSKAILALLRNDLRNRELESILLSQIQSASLDLLRRYIPETYLIHKRENEEFWRNRCNGRRFVLKESISSGMKGTVFCDDQQFDAAMKTACQSYYRFVLQEEITNRAQNFRYFDRYGELFSAEWYLRITVHYSRRQIADIIVTARQDKKVHGATDCLQIGSAITE